MGEVSPFIALQRVARSFEDVCAAALTAGRERSIRRLVDRLGSVAVPLCVRELGEADDKRARWALELLTHLSQDHGERVMAELCQLIAGDARPQVRLRAALLLADLGADAPAGWGSEQRDEVGSACGRCLRALASTLTEPWELAQAGELLVRQVTSRISGGELFEILEVMTREQPTCARRLLDELLARADIGEADRRSLRRLRAPLLDWPRPGGVGRARSAAWAGARGRADVLLLGSHGDEGSHVLVAAHPAGRGLRALCAFIGADGALADCVYREDVSPDRLGAEIARPLADRGYACQPVSFAEARAISIEAARMARHLGRPLPSAFYLGRDLVGVATEHMGPGPDEDALDLAALLARAGELVRRGEADRARPLLERYVCQAPDSPDGCAQLGLCLLVTGDVRGAMPHLRRAAWLEPDNPMHHWNLAAAAHREGRRGASYLALRCYLSRAPLRPLDDPSGSCDDRVEQARAIAAEYERVARLEHPGVEPAEVAQADDLADQARARLREGRTREAVAAAEQALRLVPGHHGAWTQLGLAHESLADVEAAARCLDRALALRPAYPPARDALARVTDLARRARTEARRARPAPGWTAGGNREQLSLPMSLGVRVD